MTFLKTIKMGKHSCCALHYQKLERTLSPGCQAVRVFRRRPTPPGCRLITFGSRNDLSEEEVDLEDKVELFLQRQAEMESGAAFARTKQLGQVIGADVVPDEVAVGYCRKIREILQKLKETRDMTLIEAKLVISIEDPRAKERRVLGIEDERGVSRDEMAIALVDAAEGRVPNDRIALRCVHDEMLNWPFLDVVGEAPSEGDNVKTYASTFNPGGDIAQPYIMGDQARVGDKPQGIADLLPSWVGYSTLYIISAIPLFLAVGAILILFYNSLK